MLKCAFCGKQYKTATERSKCELRCQGLVIPDEAFPHEANEPAVDTTNPAVEETSKHPEISAFSEATTEQLEEQDRTYRRQFHKQMNITRLVAHLSKAISDYERDYGEFIIPEFDYGNKPFCVFLDTGNKARVQMFNTTTGRYEGYADFDARLCDGACSDCTTNACYNLVDALNERDTDSCNGNCDSCNMTTTPPKEAHRCDGDCARCASAKGTRETTRANLAVTPEEFMRILFGVIFR